MKDELVAGDCLEILKGMPDDSVDLVFCSPPYEDARTYGIGFKLKGQDWVDWSAERFRECYRVSKGLVAWVVEGKTRKFQYSCTPALLMADLHRSGVKLRKPPVFHRVGIPGSGGPDWLRNDWEWVICASKGKLPWSNNKAMGHPPKYPVGGALSHRDADGRRINAQLSQRKVQVEVANPGNVVHCGAVGGGNMGSLLCHENEAPCPESLVEFFVRSFCPPGGVVLDPFSGSGTTCKVAKAWGRHWIGIDVRGSQVELSRRRLEECEFGEKCRIS